MVVEKVPNPSLMGAAKVPNPAFEGISLRLVLFHCFAWLALM